MVWRETGILQSEVSLLHKMIGKVFLIIGSVVLMFVIWNLVLGNNGVFVSIYNTVVNRVNVEGSSTNGNTSDTLTEWDEDTGGDTGGLIIN